MDVATYTVCLWISLKFLICYQTLIYLASGFPHFLFCFFRRTLNHDNVVKLHGVGIKGPRNFMVQENLSNGNVVLNSLLNYLQGNRFSRQSNIITSCMK